MGKKKDSQSSEKDVSKIMEVKIGTQIWSALNLNTTNFSNGEPIANAKTLKQWEKATEKRTAAWCSYKNSEENAKKYGNLYNWYALNDARGLAPKGWRVPTSDDFNELYEFLRENGGNIIGKLKSKNSWISDDGYSTEEEVNGTDDYGFCALPGGFIQESGDFMDLGIKAFFWTSEETHKFNAKSLHILNGNANCEDNTTDIFQLNRKSDGLSIRLIKES